MLVVPLVCAAFTPHPITVRTQPVSITVRMTLQLTRRQALDTAQQLGMAGLLTIQQSVDAVGENGPFELTIQQSELLANLASAPVRNIIVTGSSSGVGLAGAKLLTAAGHKVILACRTQAKADMAAKACMEYASNAGAGEGPATGTPGFYSMRRSGGLATGAECDLSSLRSVRAFAKGMEGKPLDTLVMNAGVSLNVGDKTEQRTSEGFELTVGTNHFGHFALSELLIPVLAGGSKPRLVVTASGVHDPMTEGGKQGGPEKWATVGDFSGLAGGPYFTMIDGGVYDPDKAYKDSKLCNMLFMAEAARRYSGVATVNAFSPGLIADPNGFFRNQNKLFASVFNTIAQTVGVAESNDFAGSALAYLSVDPNMDGKTGGWYDALPLGKHSLSKHAPSAEAQDVRKQERLW
eukprot:CAMPEP_0119324634 /NCGR_PEP_ID=MMETSP1333-20130426/63785_1 /TAXON_ID=418940 /ORGANISM="Scyphosphaera apsteinii, Strain RCC1455" /LENGTH=406 /DNA_ID=CAMNT_0007332399 /DNA_START=32 /DNA_END=1249 /DNA_ORIENTATION=+